MRTKKKRRQHQIYCEKRLLLKLSEQTENGTLISIGLFNGIEIIYIENVKHWQTLNTHQSTVTDFIADNAIVT